MLNSAIKLFTCVKIAGLLHLFLSYSVLAKAILLPRMVRRAQKCMLTLLSLHVLNNNFSGNSKNMQ